MAQQSSQAPASVHPYGPEPEKTVEKKEEWEPQSLEEALLGEPAGGDSY
jgi:hypothetical protein